MEVLKIIGSIILWVFAVAGFVDTVLSLWERYRKKHFQPVPVKPALTKKSPLPVQENVEPDLFGLVFLSSIVLGGLWIASKFQKSK